MSRKSSIIFGSTSEIGQWIIKGLRTQNTYPICLSRRQGEAWIDFGDYNQVLNALEKYRLLCSKVLSVYFCIGKYTQSALSISSPHDWIDDISVNLNYAYICYRAICETFKDTSEEIRIIYLGSTAAVSQPNEFSSYAVSRSALETLINYINKEEPANIRACCLRLGTCKTHFSKSHCEFNVIGSVDIINTIHYLENVSFHVFPDLISLRPIRSMERRKSQ